eukprot:TRINITY_DN709_c0_g1_i1.p1 TRINITY_DN709_c0_g1~~TRINITY_DN709_c0_g1_i1.p1  ORF type:complete len:171 (-),score=28.19 TRINITY_DN709_c0_g1_i1:118-630(-)
MGDSKHNRGLSVEEFLAFGDLEKLLKPSLRELWDQPDLIFTKLKKGRNDHANLVKYLMGLKDAQKEFSAHMLRLARRDSVISEGVVRDCWHHICTAHEELAQHHNRIANQLQEFIDRIHVDCIYNSIYQQNQMKWKKVEDKEKIRNLPRERVNSRTRALYDAYRIIRYEK